MEHHKQTAPYLSESLQRIAKLIKTKGLPEVQKVLWERPVQTPAKLPKMSISTDHLLQEAQLRVTRLENTSRGKSQINFRNQRILFQSEHFTNSRMTNRAMNQSLFSDKSVMTEQDNSIKRATEGLRKSRRKNFGSQYI